MFFVGFGATAFGRFQWLLPGLGSWERLHVLFRESLAATGVLSQVGGSGRIVHHFWRLTKACWPLDLYSRTSLLDLLREWSLGIWEPQTCRSLPCLVGECQYHRS